MKKIIPKNAVLIPKQADKVFGGMIFDVYQWPQKLFNDTEHIFEMLKRPDTVVIIAIVDNQVLIIDDEQPHFGRRQSFPGGRVDDVDETVEAAAQREIREETGYVFKNWRLVQVMQPHLKIEWFVHVLLAWEITNKQAPDLDAGEKIKVHAVTFDRLKHLALNKAGYLGESLSLLEEVNDIKGLLALPEYQGQTVDR